MRMTKEELAGTGAGIIRPRPRGTGDAPTDYSGLTAPPSVVKRGRFWYYPQPRIVPLPTVRPATGRPEQHRPLWCVPGDSAQAWA